MHFFDYVLARVAMLMFVVAIAVAVFFGSRHALVAVECDPFPTASQVTSLASPDDFIFASDLKPTRDGCEALESNDLMNYWMLPAFSSIIGTSAFTLAVLGLIAGISWVFTGNFDGYEYEAVKADEETDSAVDAENPKTV